MKMMIVGIDVSLKRLDVTVLKKGGGSQRKRFANTPAGIEQLLSWLEKVGAGEKGHVCMEATSVYWEDVAEMASEAGHRVSVVNPLRIKGHALSQLRRSKNDPLDGDVIADFCKTQEPEPWLPPTAEQKKLRALVRHLESLKKSRTQQQNRLSACREEAVYASLETILATLEEEIASVLQQINELIDQHPDLKKNKELLESIDGFGEKTAIHLLAELYNLPDYKNAKAAAADVGVTASEYSSGDTIRRRPRISRMGNTAVRAALYYPAITAIRHNKIVRELAQRLEARGKHKAVIRVAAMRKLIHLAYGVLKHQQPFDPAYGT